MKLIKCPGVLFIIFMIGIMDMMLFMDIVGLFIYVPLAGIVIIVQSLYLIARLADTQNIKKWFYLPSFLNIVFGCFSIYGILELIKRAV